jgi:hypothetical protein
MPGHRLRNRSDLPDELFYALSTQGQRTANNVPGARGRPEKVAKVPPLSAAQKRTLLLAAARSPNHHDCTDTRAAAILERRGLLKFEGGGYIGSQPAARYSVTEEGLTLAATLGQPDQ